jgi:hypothetical protein
MIWDALLDARDTLVYISGVAGVKVRVLLMVCQFAVAALAQRRRSLGIRDRRAEAAATIIRLIY